MDCIDACTLRLPHGPHNLHGIANRSIHQFPDCGLGVGFRERGTAFFNETVCLKHGISSACYNPSPPSSSIVCPVM